MVLLVVGGEHRSADGPPAVALAAHVPDVVAGRADSLGIDLLELDDSFARLDLDVGDDARLLLVARRDAGGHLIVRRLCAGNISRGDRGAAKDLAAFPAAKREQ